MLGHIAITGTNVAPQLKRDMFALYYAKEGRRKRRRVKICFQKIYRARETLSKWKKEAVAFLKRKKSGE